MLSYGHANGMRTAGTVIETPYSNHDPVVLRMQLIFIATVWSVTYNAPMAAIPNWCIDREHAKSTL